MGHLTSELGHFLAGLSIARDSDAPIHEQLRHHLQYLITTAAVGPGSALPAVRQLAAELHVARATVQRAYTELRTLGLIESKHGAGTFVVDFRGAVGVVGGGPLAAVAAVAIAEARRLRLDLRDLERVMHAQIRDELRSSNELLICYVDEFDLADGYRAVLADSLADLPARVALVALEDCRNGDAEPLATLEAADLVVCAPYVFGPVSRILGNHSADIEGVTLVLDDEVAATLSQLKPSLRVGVLATRPEYMSWTSAVARSRLLTVEEPLQAALTDIAGTKEMLDAVDVAIYGAGCRGAIESLLPPEVRRIELRHVPDPSSLARLRELVTQRIGIRDLAHAGARR